MKSKTSYFNKTIFKKNITHYWPIWGIILLWNLFVLPFMIYDSSLQYRYNSNMTQSQLNAQRVNDIVSLIQVYINPVILFLFSVAAVMAVFSYLHSTRTANTFHALPVTRLELFITNYVSGLLFLVVPEAVGFLMGTLVSAVCGYTSINYLFTGLLFACGTSFFFYTFTVFITMFTGQLFAIPVFSLILNLLFVGSRLIVSSLVECLSYGISWGFSGSRLDVLSPLYYFIRNVGVEYDYSAEYVSTKGFEGAGIVAGYALVALALVAAAYCIYRRRHIETAGNLISISWICPVFRWGAAFCGGSLFGVGMSAILGITSNRNLFLAVTLFSALFGTAFFFGAQMFLEKGFRVFKKKRFLECGVFLAILVCLMISIECDLFGREKKMPQLAEIENAYISNPYTIGGDNPEQIQQILDLHSQIIASKKEFEAFAEDKWQYGEDLLGITVKYYLKDGSLLRRAYSIPLTEEMLLDKNTVAGKLAELSKDPEVYLDNLFGGDYKNIEIRDGNFDYYDENGLYDNRVISGKNMQKIYQAVVKDVEAGNFEDCIVNGFCYGEAGDFIEEPFCNVITIRFMDNEPMDAGRERNRREYNMWAGYGNVGISFDKNCRNVIEALMDAGLIRDEGELYTNEEMERLTGEEDTFVD